MKLHHVELAIDIDAPPETVFAAMSQWAEQGRWMLGTKVEVRAGDGASVGSELAAWTGVAGLGFWDTMVLTRWEPPARADVLHTGRVVRGTGTMLVQALGPGRSRFIWSEDLELPLGALGRLGWPLVRPAFLAGVKASLRSLRRLVEAGDLPVTQGARGPADQR